MNHIIERLMNSDKQFDEIYNQYILPEILRRKSLNTLPENFEFWDCLIKFPKIDEPVILFNTECDWKLVSQPKDGAWIRRGARISPEEYGNIERAQPPVINGEITSFVYVSWNLGERGREYDIFLDDLSKPNFDSADFDLGGLIAWHIRKRQYELIIKSANLHKDKLNQIGLWPCISLVPYPLFHILERLEVKDTHGARRLLLVACGNEFVDSLVESWFSSNLFLRRQQLFNEIIQAHTQKMYHLCIYALIPQIEGIITDWLCQIDPTIKGDLKIKKKAELFKQYVDATPDLSDSFRDVLVSTVEFFTDSTPLANFSNWLARLDSSFPNRHGVSHGFYQSDMFSQENSIKLFLLIDSVCEFIFVYRTEHST